MDSFNANMSLASSLRDPSLFVEKSYINGQWTSSASTFSITNPATEKHIATCPESTPEDLSNAIQAASTAFLTWRTIPGRQLGQIPRRLSDLLVKNKSDLGKIITAENGKAKADTEGEALFSASFFEWLAEEAPRVYGDIIPHSSATSRTHVLKEPVGVWGLRAHHAVEFPTGNGYPEDGCCVCRGMYRGDQVRWVDAIVLERHDGVC